MELLIKLNLVAHLLQTVVLLSESQSNDINANLNKSSIRSNITLSAVKLLTHWLIIIINDKKCIYTFNFRFCKLQVLKTINYCQFIPLRQLKKLQLVLLYFQSGKVHANNDRHFFSPSTRSWILKFFVELVCFCQPFSNKTDVWRRY